MLLIIVHRLLQSIILPPLNSLVFIVIGLSLLIYFRKVAYTLISFGIFFLYIQSTPFFAYHITKMIETPPVTAKQIKEAAAIIVLGGGVNTNALEYPINTVANTGTLIRLRYASYLAHQYPTKLIITSGGYNNARFPEAIVMRDTLITVFNVHNPILVETKSRNTDENAKYTVEMLKLMHISNVLIITQAYHMRRAIALFKKYGVQAVGAPTDFYDNVDALTPQLTLVPNAAAMQATSRIIHEILGYLFYIGHF